jgi:large subunit ribosomal protein L19
MNASLIAKVQESFSSQISDKELRDSLRVGDTIVANTRIYIAKKIQKALTTAEKQAAQKAALTGSEELKIQPFKGVIVAFNGTGKNTKVVVRKIGSDGIGVEKIVPLYGNILESVELVSRGKPRRSKLYYLRDRIGKQALRVREDAKVA